MSNFGAMRSREADRRIRLCSSDGRDKLTKTKSLEKSELATGTDNFFYGSSK